MKMRKDEEGEAAVAGQESLIMVLNSVRLMSVQRHRLVADHVRIGD